jgi:hypothetical protein
VRINFGEQGIAVQKAIRLVQEEIKGLNNNEVKRAITIKLESLAEKYKDIQVLSIEVKPEEFSDLPWKKETVEVIRYVTFEITILQNKKIEKIEGYTQYGGEFFRTDEIEDVEQLNLSMNKIAYDIFKKWEIENQTGVIKGDNVKVFIEFITEKLFIITNEVASEFPWYFWFWDSIYKFSSVNRMHSSIVPIPIARLFFASVGLMKSTTETQKDMEKSQSEYLERVNDKKFREARVKISYICNQWYYLNELSFASDILSNLEIVRVEPEQFNFMQCVFPKIDDSEGNFDFSRAIELNTQRTKFSGGYPRGFSWFFTRTYINMLLSHFEKDYPLGPPKNIPLFELARAILPIRDNLLREYGIEPEYLLCIIGAYLNFFNNWLYISVKKDPDFIPFFTIDEQTISKADNFLDLSGHFKSIKEKFKEGKLSQKYNKAAVPDKWDDIIRLVHDKLSIEKNDVHSLNVTENEKPYLFYKFKDGEYVVCCIELLLGLDKLLLHFGSNGEFGRIKGQMFEEISSHFPSSSGWIFGRNLQITEKIGQKMGTDLDILLLKPPYAVVCSCKTEGSDKVWEIKNAKEAVKRWEQLKTFLTDIDDLGIWLKNNFYRNDIQQKIFSSIKSDGHIIKQGDFRQILNGIKYIIPIVVTPGTEFIIDINQNTMLTDWIPRICTPKELSFYLDKSLALLESTNENSFVINLIETKDIAPTKKPLKEDEKWSFIDFTTRQIAVVSKNDEKTEIIAFDIESGMNVVLEISPKINLKSLKKAELYVAQIQVYAAKKSDIENNKIVELAKREINIANLLKSEKSGLIIKLKLIGITLYKPTKMKEPERGPLFYQPTYKNAITKKTVSDWNKDHPDRQTNLQIAPKTSRQCRICKKYFTRADKDLIHFLEPIYPTEEFEDSMNKVTIDNTVNDPFICSRCFRIKGSEPKKAI